MLMFKSTQPMSIAASDLVQRNPFGLWNRFQLTGLPNVCRVKDVYVLMTLTPPMHEKVFKLSTQGTPLSNWDGPAGACPRWTHLVGDSTPGQTEGCSCPWNKETRQSRTELNAVNKTGISSAKRKSSRDWVWKKVKQRLGLKESEAEIRSQRKWSRD